MSDEDPIGKEETTFYRDEGRKRTPRHPSSGTRGSISPQIRYDSLVLKLRVNDNVIDIYLSPKIMDICFFLLFLTLLPPLDLSA